MKLIRAALARRPLTVAVVAVIVAVYAVSLIQAAHGTLLAPVAGLDPRALQQHRWWSVATSLVVAGSAAQAMLAVVAAVVGLGWAERLLGARRSLVALVVTGVVASLLGVAAESLGALVHEYWSTSVHGIVVLDPLTPICGAIAWATAAARPVWRRRVRVLLVATASALLLYSGQPADLYLLVAVLLGWAGGRITEGAAARSPRSRHETRSLLALATAVVAVGPLLTFLSATRYGVLSPLGAVVSDLAPVAPAHPIGCAAGHLVPACARELTRAPVHSVGGVLVALLLSAVLLIGARGIIAGRRVAIWLLAGVVVVEGLLAASSFGVLPAIVGRSLLPVVPGRYAELRLWLVASTVVPIGFGVVLVLHRRVTPLLPSRRRVAAAGAVLVAAVVVPALVYLGGGMVAARSFRPTATLPLLLAALPARLAPPSFLRHDGRSLVPVGAAAHLVTQVAGPLFWMLVLVAALIAVQGRRGLPVEAADGERIRALVRAGSGSLGWMATWAESRLWISADGRSGVAYRLVDGVAITVSDPIGADDDPDSVVSAFVAFCDAAAWTPAFYSVHDRWRAVLERRGWVSLGVAEEALLDPARFSLSGGRMRDIRTSVNRAGRTGVVVLWTTWSHLPLRIAAQIDELSEEWMAERELPELGFTLGGLDELRDDDVLIGVAIDASQRVLATTSWLPFYRKGRLVGRTLDLMRRSPSSPNGVMEFLIAAAMERFRDEGLDAVSLSATPLAAQTGALGPLGTILDMVARRLEPLYGFRSLLRFKVKFGAGTAPISLCYLDPVDLPRIGLAIARAYLPGMTLADARAALRRGR